MTMAANITNITDIVIKDQTSNVVNSSVYCGKNIDAFHATYRDIHGYVSLLVCIFGCIANSLNIIVLTRKEMRSATNAILTGLAVADLLVMIDYIPYSFIAFIFRGSYSRVEYFSYRNACIIITHSIFAQICHTVSIWLTVTLAVWRYIAVAYPQTNRLWCQMKNTIVAIILSYVICPILTIPIYMTYSILATYEIIGPDGEKATNSTPEGDKINATLYRVGFSERARNNVTFYKANFWIFSVFIKLIPCVALTILSWCLIHALLEAKRRRKNLMSNSNGMKLTTVNGKPEKKKKNSKIMDKEKQTDRTTKMLLAVLLLFLLTEFPQGIFGLFAAILGDAFYVECYANFGDIMDVLALINSAINFILYCSMSRQFRTQFSLLFRPKFLDRWLPVPQDGDEDNPNGRGKDNNGHTTHVTQISQV